MENNNNLIINEGKLETIKNNLTKLNIKLDHFQLENGHSSKRIGILAEPIKKQPEQRRFLPNLSGGNIFGSIFLFVKGMYKYLIIIPIIVFILLYVKKPKILLTKNKRTNETKLDKMKLQVATAAVTLVMYVLLFLYFKKYRQEGL